MSDGTVTKTIDYTLARAEVYGAAVDRAIESADDAGVALFAAGYRAACDDILAVLVGDDVEGAGDLRYRGPAERAAEWEDRYGPTPAGVAAVDGET